MLKSFQRRFILITMALVAVVSGVAFSAIGVVSYQSLRLDISNALNTALEGGQAGVPAFPGFGSDEDSSYDSSVPTYTVTVTWAGLIYEAANNTASLDSSVVAEVVDAALSANSTSGFLSAYGLFYKSSQDASGYTIAFASAATLNESIASTTLMLVVFWLLLMAAVFIITLYLSRFVSRPVLQAWEQQQRFVADASHELKTPLAIILANSAILAEHPQATVAEQERWISGISEEAQRMQTLTEDLLTLASADATSGAGAAKDARAAFEQVDFSQLVARASLQFEALAFERQLVLEEEVAPGLQVNGDAAALDRLVKTLVENACKYAGTPGNIDVNLAAVRNQAVLQVRNSGNPISEEDLPHIFERFYRSDKSRAREGASASFGLGLAIAKSCAEQHGGSISAASDGNGTTFTVKIPLAQAALPA